jgi:hypothetical protein
VVNARLKGTGPGESMANNRERRKMQIKLRVTTSVIVTSELSDAMDVEFMYDTMTRAESIGNFEIGRSPGQTEPLLC